MPFLTLSNNPEKRQRQVEFGQAVDRETERVQNVQDLISAIQTLRAGLRALGAVERCG